MGMEFHNNSYNLHVVPNQFSPQASPEKSQNQTQVKTDSPEMFVEKSVHAVKTEKPVHQVQVPPNSNTEKSITPQQAQTMAKQMKGTVSYQYNAPKVDVPEHLHQTMSKEEIGKLKAACMEDYKTAMHTMEESVADVASTHNDALQFAGTLSGRLLKFIEAYAEVQLEAEGRISAETPENVKNAEITKRVNGFLVDIFSETKQMSATSSDGKTTVQGSVQKGISHEAGNVGMNPLTIRKAITEGNLREKLYFPSLYWTKNRLMARTR